MKCFSFIIAYFCSGILKQDTKKGKIYDLASFLCIRSRNHNFQLKMCVMLEKTYAYNLMTKYWHIRGIKDDWRRSLVSMLILYVTCFNPPWIVPVRVTKLPTTFFMFTEVPSTYLDQWLALSTDFPREYIFSLTIMWFLSKMAKKEIAISNTGHPP